MRSGESPDSIKLLEAILERGLRSRENKDGETPADLATKFGYKRMAAALGIGSLLSKPNSLEGLVKTVIFL